jgi:hypothetical protein
MDLASLYTCQTRIQQKGAIVMSISWIRNSFGILLLVILAIAGCGGGSGQSSNVATAPTSVTATPGNGTITIAWTGAPGATSYNIYWSTSPGITPSNGVKITGATNPYTLTGLVNGTTYYLLVTAVGAAGELPASEPSSATPALPFPTGVTATPANAQMTIAWIAVPGATSYNLYVSSTSGVTPSNGTKIAGASNPYVVTGLSNGTSYYAVVTAVFTSSESDPSPQVSAIPTAPSSGVAFTSYVGNWAGSWHNNTFGSSGPASLAVGLNPAGTQMTWTISVQGNVFGGISPPAETFIGAVTSSGITLTGTSVTFGQLRLTIDPLGNVTGSGINVNSPNVSRFDFSGTWTAAGFNLTYTATLTVGGTASGTFFMSKQ